VPNKFDNLLNNRPTSSSVKNNSSTRNLTGALFVPASEVVPNPNQVRKTFNQRKDQELADDIKAHGILEPLLVRKNNQDKYEIVAGERRYRAAQLAGLTEVPVIIKNWNDQEARLVQLSENLQRQDLDPFEEKSFFETLMNEYNLSQQEIATMINKSRGYVAKRLAGALKGMQELDREEDISPTLEETASLTSSETASEGNHKMLQESNMLKKSQNVSRDNVRPLRLDKTLYRLGQAIDNIATSLHQNGIPDDQLSVDQLNEGIVQVEQKLADLKDLLSRTGL
jgi:ParB family chromosome partitioning protein